MERFTSLLVCIAAYIIGGTIFIFAMFVSISLGGRLEALNGLESFFFLFSFLLLGTGLREDLSMVVLRSEEWLEGIGCDLENIFTILCGI